MTNIELKMKLRELKDKGLTYKAMAQNSGVGYSVIRNFVSDYRDSMSQENLDKLEDWLNCIKI